jgi:REase_MTES_1575/Transcriptional regulator, AbiEi antitoxin
MNGLQLYPGLLPAVRVAREQDGMITYRQALAAGLTREQLRWLVARGWWSSPTRGTFVIQGASALRARVRAALAGRPAAVACGITAARLLGFNALPAVRPEEPVHLQQPGRATRSQARGVRLHWGDVPMDQLVDVDGIPATAPARTLADLVLGANRDDAVALMDGALHSGQVGDLEGASRAASGRHGSRRARSWWPLADGRAESPLESRLRLLLSDGGLPPPEVQWTVKDGAGRVVARLDLAWPQRRLDVEADGAAVHSDPTALYRDRHRQNLVAGLGWTVLRFTWSDVERRPTAVIAAVAAALTTTAPD